MTDIQYYLLFFLLWLLSILFLKSLFKPTTTLRLPPALPLVGYLHFFTPPIPVTLHNLSTKYGPLLHLHLGASQMVLVSSASMAAKIFKTQDLSFAERPLFSFSDKIPYANDGFFSAKYGEYWRFLKKVCMTELFGQRQLEQSRNVRREEVARFLRKVMKSADKREAIDIGSELMKLANNSICRMTLSTVSEEKGSGRDEEAEKMIELIKKAVELAVRLSIGDVLGPLKRLVFWIYGRKMIDVIVNYDEILERIMKEHEERGKRDGFEREDRDLMDILLKVYEDDKAEVKITREQIKTFFSDILIGGTNTSSDVMQWTISELVNHPHIFNKVREEISSVIGSNNRLIEESDVPNLPYLQVVIKEALRLYPGLPLVSRNCRESCKIQGFDIPKETNVTVNLHAIMRDPEIWENPNEFRPERFLLVSSQQGSEVTMKKEMAMEFSFVPFGGGRRRCPGSTLALSLISATIGAMVQCFDWKLVGDEDKLNMQIGTSMGFPRAHPLVLVPVLRFNPFD